MALPTNFKSKFRCSCERAQASLRLATAAASARRGRGGAEPPKDGECVALSALRVESLPGEAGCEADDDPSFAQIVRDGYTV